MFCPNCKAEIPEGSTRCRFCGAPIHTISSASQMLRESRVQPAVEKPARHDAGVVSGIKNQGDLVGMRSFDRRTAGAKPTGSVKRPSTRRQAITIAILLAVAVLIVGALCWYIFGRTSTAKSSQLTTYLDSSSVETVASTLSTDGYTTIGSVYVKAPDGKNSTTYLATVAGDAAAVATGNTSAFANILEQSSGAEAVVLLDATGAVLSGSSSSQAAGICRVSLDASSASAAEALSSLESEQGLSQVAGTEVSDGLTASGTTSSGNAWTAKVVSLANHPEYASGATGYVTLLSVSNSSRPVALSDPKVLLKSFI